jgi:hypothetical protein
MRFGLVIGFIEPLQNVTTSNYSTIANSYTLLFTAARTMSFQSALSSPVVKASNAVASSASVFRSLLAGDCFPTNSQAGGHLAPTTYCFDWLQLN